MVGLGAFNVQNNFPPGGPPFVPGAAENGVSVDPISGNIVWGNSIGGTGAELLSSREIEMQNFLFRLVNGGQEQFLVDPVTGLYQLGDIGNTIGGSMLSVDDSNGIILLALLYNGATASPALNLDGSIGLFELGDIGFAQNRTRVSVDDPASVVRIHTDAELMLFLASQVYSMGNVNDTLNGSKITIDDANDTFDFLSLGRGRMLNLSGFNQVYRMGDIDVNGNGNVFSINEVGSVFSLGNTAANAGISINGVAGFTGTVNPVTSITVNSGIVTAVA